MKASTEELHHMQVGRPVVVSIVSHGQSALVEKLLSSLNRTSARMVAKVVVTCNIPETRTFSQDGWGFPLEIIDNSSPKGFGANHNAAFRHCTAPWFLVLNPDMEFPADPIAPLLALASPDTGLLAPLILEPGHAAPEPHRRLITPMEIIVRRFRSYAPPSSPDWVAGMFMLLRAKAFAETGGFDEKFFMYVEDADLCARLSLAGWGIRVHDAATVIHDARRASRRHWRPLAWHLASLARWWTSAAFWRSLLKSDNTSMR